jgi:hypothetical protein
VFCEFNWTATKLPSRAGEIALWRNGVGLRRSEVAMVCNEVAVQHDEVPVIRNRAFVLDN